MRRMALTLAVIAAACGGADSGTTTTTPPTGSTTTAAPATEVVVVSSDGAVTMTVAADSLPPGLDPTALAIEPFTADAGEAGFTDIVAAGIGLGSAYRLLPDGIEFAQPAQILIDPPDDGSLVTAFVVAGGVAEPLDFDEEGGVFLLPHTSALVTASDGFTASFVVPSIEWVGNSFGMRSEVHRSPIRPGPFDLRVTVRAASPVSPASQEAPPVTRAAGPSFTAYATGTCDAPGIAHIEQIAVVTEIPDPATLGQGRKIEWIGSEENFIECVPIGGERPVVSGIYAGTLTNEPIAGTPGVAYEDEYEFILDDCGDALVIQAQFQISLGKYFTVYEDDSTEVDVTAENVQEGDDPFIDGYRGRLTFDPLGLTVDWSGINAGWGHGLGDPPDNGLETLNWITFWVDRSGGSLPGEFDDDTFAAGWLYSTQGTLERVGDAPPCDEE